MYVFLVTYLYFAFNSCIMTDVWGAVYPFSEFALPHNADYVMGGVSDQENKKAKQVAS